MRLLRLKTEVSGSLRITKKRYAHIIIATWKVREYAQIEDWIKYHGISRDMRDKLQSSLHIISSDQEALTNKEEGYEHRQSEQWYHSFPRLSIIVSKLQYFFQMALPEYLIQYLPYSRCFEHTKDWNLNRNFSSPKQESLAFPLIDISSSHFFCPSWFTRNFEVFIVSLS